MSTHPRPRRSPAARLASRRSALARLAAIALLTASAAGCLAVPPVMLTQRALSDKEPEGDELRQLQQESAPYQKRGTGSISGTVGMQSGGTTIPAAPGTTVYLTPVTTYATARLQHYAIEENELPARPNSQVAWITRTEAGGQFRFRELPPGSYYVVGQMFWSPPGDPAGSRGDVVYATVQLAPGESTTVFVTRPPASAH